MDMVKSFFFSFSEGAFLLSMVCKTFPDFSKTFFADMQNISPAYIRFIRLTNSRGLNSGSPFELKHFSKVKINQLKHCQTVTVKFLIFLITNRGVFALRQGRQLLGAPGHLGPSKC